MPELVRRVFVSYSHEDAELARTVFTHLKGLEQFFPVELWIDAKQIRAGDRWQPEIDKALNEADMAVLLISPAFMASAFITAQELPRLLRHRDDKGLRIIPILLRPCAWPEWLASTEIRPRGDHALSELAGQEPARVDRSLKEIVEEMADLFAEPTRSSSATVPSRPPAADDRAGRLLSATLLADVPDPWRGATTDRLVGAIRQHTSLAGEGLFNAVRLFVEWALLRVDEPTSPAALESSLAAMPASDRARALVNRLRQGARAGDFSSTPVEVNSRFFSRTNEHADLWKRYFDALDEAAVAPRDTLASLVSVRVSMGFLAPQFLVAGLLSRFDDDWRPVLNAYQRAVPNPKHRRGGFESLQASQWNCWLMWGPSIPVCACEQWQGFVALQYGYGDENNSVPVLELASDDHGAPRTLGPIAASLRGERRGAKFTALTGRLRWGPWFLRAQTSPPAAQDVQDLADLDREPEEESRRWYGVAPAQSTLYDGHGLAHRAESDGLVFQLESVVDSQPETRVYFSAYLWLMFLVATPPRGGDAEAPAPPALLRAKPYPDWPEPGTDRRQVREARLWEDLVPVFVHANIGDPEALRFQRAVLVENALHTLRQLWDRRQELFDAGDVTAGLQFHLVCGSDYSGCGCEIRFPADDSLVQQLRRRLAVEPDRAFAERVVLPAETGDSSRPWQLAGYFSACHLPEMVADYYVHVAEVSKPASRP